MEQQQYVGIDLHRRRSVIVRVDEHGGYSTPVRIDNDAAVLAAGVATTGPTVHLVTDGYDEGEVLAHAEVPVLPGDTADSLGARVLAAEHDLYWRAIQALFG